MQTARWFKLGNRYELVYVVGYVKHNGEENKYVEIRRMNHKPWTEPLHLKLGYTSLSIAQSAICYPISFTTPDIEWFLHNGMKSFLTLYEKQVM